MEVFVTVLGFHILNKFCNGIYKFLKAVSPLSVISEALYLSFMNSHIIQSWFNEFVVDYFPVMSTLRSLFEVMLCTVTFHKADN
jgi:hypothetical protein